MEEILIEIPALGRLRWDDHNIEASLGYIPI
jgi:hypothetical protein